MKKRRRKWGIEVGLNIAEARPSIHANVPTGPVIDGCGCRRRSLRKCQPARRKAENGPGQTGNEPVAHWPGPPTLSLISGFQGKWA
jgi:hypothetical protein